jgi:hypothetical protein
LLHIDRRKCILFVNDKTLFNFIAPDVNREQIRGLSELFYIYLSCVLASEGLPEKVQISIKEEYRNIEYAGTKSRSVLGSMNDLAFHYKHHILSEGGIHSAMVPEIIHKLNHMPMGAIEYKYSMDAIKSLYATTT